MRVGIHAGSNQPDQIVEHCRQADVDEVFLAAAALPGLPQRGYLRPDEIEAVRDALAERGVKVSGMIAPVPSREAVLGDNDAEVSHLCRTLRAMGESGIETTLFYPLDRFIYFQEYHPGKPLAVTQEGEAWDAVIEFFRRVVNVADEVDLKLAHHLWAVDMLHAIWAAVGSPNNGVAYCQGMYIFGENPHTAVDQWGIDRIFCCHARNLTRHGRSFQDYEEVPLDQGDVDIALCVRNLMAAGYDGVIIPEHLGENGSLSAAVAYLKRIIEG
jgi:D-mannonate dehydratase